MNDRQLFLIIAAIALGSTAFALTMLNVPL